MTMTLEREPRPFDRLGVRLNPDHLSDGQLLRRYVGERDEVAFAVLVRRHAGLVYGVCRRVLRNGADADDAFQAAFLVLLRKADSLTERATVGDWLYAVAVRVAMKARGLTAKRYRKEATAANRRPAEDTSKPVDSLDWFDRELNTLPARYREPVVLCLIQQQPREAAAAALGIPEGTLASRLAYAKKWLADRLTRRGISASAALVAAAPAALLDATSAQASGTPIPSPVDQLATGAMQAMFITKLRIGLLAAVGVLLVGGVTLMAAPADRPTVRKNAPVPEKKEPPEPDWMKRFKKVYQLKEGEYVKRVAPPYIDERLEFMTTLFPGAKEGDPGVMNWNSMGALFLEADGKTVKYKRMLSTDATDPQNPTVKVKKKRLLLSSVIESCTGRITPEVAFDERAAQQAVFVEDDFVLRKDAPLEKLLPDLQKAIGECELDVILTPPVLALKEVEQEVYVVSGKFQIKPREWREADEVDVYADEATMNKAYNHRGHSGDPEICTRWYYTTSPAEFAKTVGSFVNRRLVWDTELAPVTRFNWYQHDRWDNKATADTRAADHDPEKVLRNVSEQTGLTFKKEKRKVPVLVVSVPEKK